MERDFKGVWIPKDIWLNKELSILEKCLITEIDSLDNSDKGCFASNKYLSEFIGVSEGRCANIISDLKKREFIVQCFFDGRNRGLMLHENVKPTLKGESRLHENVKADLTETLKQASRKREHSNTVNNTGINTDNNTNGSIEPDGVDFPKLKEYWNSKAVRVSKILDIDKVREKSILSLVNKYNKVVFFTAIKNMLESDFHNLDLSQKWKGNFDWVLKPQNFKKMLELDNSVQTAVSKTDKSKWVFG